VVPGDRAEVLRELHAVAIGLLRRLRAVDAASGLSPARLSLLSVLVFSGPRTLGELAAIEQVRPPTMTKLVRGLEAEGWVTTSPVAHDRRVVRVTATDAGRALLEAARDRRLARLDALLGPLGDAELAALSNVTRLLRGRLGQTSAD
jgi:DNA-binding MarR family transcriptional regulator